MIQLILAGIVLPEAEPQEYKCYLQNVSQELRMISGRKVVELYCRPCIIEYSYKYFAAPDLEAILQILRGGESIEVTYYNPETRELNTGFFHCVSWPEPEFLFTDRDDVPYFGNISFTLESVYPV